MSHCIRIVGAAIVVARRLALVAAFLVGGDHRAWAQSGPVISPGPFIHQETLTFDENFGGAGRPLAIDGDTALVALDGMVSVYERDGTTDLWSRVTQIVPSDGAPTFGRALDFDGRRAIIGAAGAAYVFRRQPGGAQVWHEEARLLPSDGRETFGAAVAVDGTHAIVGAIGNVQRNLDGAAYVFKRTSGGWQEVAALGPPVPAAARFGFGISLDISGDTAIVGAGGLLIGEASIFDRNQGGTDNWGFVKDLARILSSSVSVAIEGDTAVIGGGIADLFRPFVVIYGRNEGGPDNWGRQAGSGGDPQPVCCGVVFSTTSIRGDYVIFGIAGAGGSVQIRARNQGGPNAWGLVSRFSNAPSSSSAFYASVALAGDTALFDADPALSNRTVSVFVSDLDGDGIRDGLDPCVRDPLNNIAGGCQRSTADHPVLDDLIAQGDVTTEQHGRRYLITATFTNTSTTAVKNPFFAVTELTGRNVLVNGDAGRGGLGATLSPDVGDGILSPGEPMRVTFRIRLRSQGPFQFFVTLHGDPVQ